jgi:hypothetical protein
MEHRSNQFASMRVVVPKEVCTKFKVYAINNIINVSEMIWDYIHLVVRNESVYFN